MPERRPLGLIGGTFDPVHFGHLRLAEEAREALKLESVRWIPAGQPPHRGTPAVTAAQRLDMVRLAVEGNPAFELDDAEVRANQPSFTVLTLERLRRELGPEAPLVLLMGADAFLGLTTWKRWRDLFCLAHIAVATRPGYGLTETEMPAELLEQYRNRRVNDADALPAAPAGFVISFPITALDISATAIRRHLGAGESPRYLLPASVLAYIESHHLYR